MCDNVAFADDLAGDGPHENCESSLKKVFEDLEMSEKWCGHGCTSRSIGAGPGSSPSEHKKYLLRESVNLHTKYLQC